MLDQTLKASTSYQRRADELASGRAPLPALSYLRTETTRGPQGDYSPPLACETRSENKSITHGVGDVKLTTCIRT
jgi:hypothetical protein